MADQRITDLTALTGANTAPTDVFVLVDVSDTTMGATGTDKKITRQELQTYNAGTLTTDVKTLDLSATWNNAAVTFTGKLNAFTDTASNAASLLENWTVGGNSKYKIDKSGNTTQAGKLNLVQSQAGAIDFNPGSNGAMIYQRWNSSIAFAFGGVAAGNEAISFDAAGAYIRSNAAYRWSSSATDSYATDLALFRDAANTLAQRNGTNAQTFNHYGHYVSATSYSRLAIKHAVTTLASVSGATVTATGLIPAKANVLGVNTKIMVELGTGGGTTGYAVGDGTDPNRWGDVVGTATTVSSAQADATADPTGWFNAAGNVVITAAGGNFNGTGSILIDVAYTMTEAD